MNTKVEGNIYDRSQLLLGSKMTKRLEEVKVIVFGIGGVGSWCIESLLRSGITHLTIVDSDTVSPSNVNRQLMATSLNVGLPKTEVMKERLLAINPDASIQVISSHYCDENHEQFNLGSYDYIIDAIDSFKDKYSLILRACQSGAVFFSSMGAALKVDPTRIKVAEFWNVRGCPLGAALRKRCKQRKTYPAHKFRCVYSEEVLPNLGEEELHPVSTDGHAQVNGSLSHITGIFGLTLAGLVMKDIYEKAYPESGKE